jgi:hypothetical protein
MSKCRVHLASFLFVFVSVTALAQTDSAVFLDQLAGLVNRGKLNIEVNLRPGSAAITPQWTVQAIGAPKATLTVEADEGRVRCLDVNVTSGKLLIAGKGLRPALWVEGIRFEEGAGIVDARFRGRGMWKPIVAVFRALARRTLGRLDIPSDIRSILRGEILISKESSSHSSSDFLALVRDVHINNSEFEAFAGYPIAFGELIELDTRSLRVAIDKGTFTPPARFEVDGRIDGEIENGSAAFVGSHCTFSRGQLRDGAFRVVSSDKGGQPETSFSAGTLTIDLTSGEFRWPGGPKVGVEAPSHFAVRDLRVRPDGSYSGTVDAELFGKAGSIDRAGMTVAANDVHLHTSGARIVDGKATGDVKLNFQYRLNHVLVVHYPVEELRDRRVPLLFQGAFAADLHFENAGSGDEGVVTGQYQFTIPWPPVEQAAFEVLRAKWQEDIAPAIHKVDFVIEPRHFGPCGRDCFLLDLKVTAEKTKTNGYLFQQICDTEGKADVVVDAPSRSLLLRNVRVEPHCRGVLGPIVGAIAKFVAPFLAKSYSDVVLLQMPQDLPFTIESVGSGTDSIFIAGRVEWTMKLSAITSTAPAATQTHHKEIL